ncbi:MAG: cytochrome c oxidase subunit II transmembrane domain-containing protein, partial [Bacteroidota bacterium]|nr:cytochrome c oxidase subunit II transmembrane domain-containing protein [Bacteroidota bacterium]
MSAFIILAVLILLFTAFFFIGKISETSISIRKANASEDGEDSYDDMEYVSNINGYLSLAFMVGFLFLSFYGTLHYLPRMIPKLANSIHGQDLDKMFMRTYYITAAIFLITHVVLFAFVFMYRYKRNRKAYFFSHSNTLEIIWTTIPAIAMAYLVYTGIIAWNETFTKDNSFT